MKKNAFTLVELLAVIVIMGVLSLVVLPNVINSFNDSKKNTFLNELRLAYKVAKQQFVKDSAYGIDDRIYSNCSSCSLDKLDLSGRSEFKYLIKIDREGCINEYKATDGTYQYSFDSGCLSVGNINDVETVSEIDESRIITID